MDGNEKKQPAYLRLYDTLRRRIIAGDYPYGARLPSKRALSEETGLSVVTVEHALALLCDEGYLEPRERSGHYVSFREAEGFVPESLPVRPAPPAEAGERTAFPMSVLARHMRRVLSDENIRILERAPSGGRKPGCPPMEKNIVPSPGFSTVHSTWSRAPSSRWVTVRRKG